MELKPSVRVPQVRADTLAPARPPSPPPGRDSQSRLALVVGAHLLMGVAAYAVLFTDLDLHPELKGGLIGVMVRDVLAVLGKCYDYFLPQND